MGCEDNPFPYSECRLSEKDWTTWHKVQRQSNAFFKFKITYYYEYHEDSCTATQCIIIEDLEGHKSLTNDLENVLNDISKHVGINPKNYLIVYRDSDYTWDGYDYLEGTFTYLGAENEAEAIRRYLLKRNEDPDKDVEKEFYTIK